MRYLVPAERVSASTQRSAVVVPIRFHAPPFVERSTWYCFALALAVHLTCMDFALPPVVTASGAAGAECVGAPSNPVIETHETRADTLADVPEPMAIP